jgi:hypothetical protein
VRRAQYVRRAIALGDDGPCAAKARRDATHRAIAVARSSPDGWKFNVGRLKFLDGGAVRPFW